MGLIYFLPNIVRVIKEDEKCYRILVGKLSLLKLLWGGWEDKIRIGLKGSWEGINCINLAQDRDN
jgi:hypothetical protein